MINTAVVKDFVEAVDLLPTEEIVSAFNRKMLEDDSINYVYVFNHKTMTMARYSGIIHDNLRVEDYIEELV